MNSAIIELEQSKSWFIEKHLARVEHPLKPTAIKLLLISDYATRQIERLLSLLNQDDCQTLLSRDDYFNAIKKIQLSANLAQFQRELRHFRHWHFLRLLLLQLDNRATTEDIMQAWSDCADALILHALEYSKQQLAHRYGLPRDEEGLEAHCYTIAMGKLGGRELNFSSDIDLIFAFSNLGFTDGEESISNEQFFQKIVQQFIQLLHHVTADGFVFRVDLRLRPNGDSGPLISCLDAMETYYQEQGRDWERYAMVKARVISPSLTESHPWFTRLITPFVYRRYVDFSVIESLRSMKAMIEREVQLNPRLDDIKRGKGGIREVEFIIQNFQLIRGGRLPQLQQQNALKALAVLKEEHLLPRSDALKQAYLFLRQFENVLQGLNDQQTHALPEDPLKQTQTTLGMGYGDWDELVDKLHQYQRIISHAFHSILDQVDVYQDEKRMLANQLASLWQGHIETSMAVNLLASIGYEKAEQCYQMVHTFRHSPRCRRLTQGARMRLDRFMLLLFTELSQSTKTDEILSQVLQLLENIVGRSAYLALLTENPQALRELLYWFANSPFISALLVSQPFLLEVLLEQGQAWRPQSKTQLDKLLTEKLSHTDDLEHQEDLLRQFKLTHWLMAARAELYGYYDAVRIGKFLSDVAEVIVKQVLIIACKQLSAKQPEIHKIKQHFAIIAYGKLGSREMNYSSDLDLVFLHNAPTSEEALVTRLTQKILHMLTTRLQTGILYAVDTRLRPSGAAGLLVSHVDAFVTYQLNEAWTWEHQALIKARIIWGNAHIKEAFHELKQTVLAVKREATLVQQEVRAMREKINQQQQGGDTLKHAVGGLLDLEFLLQFLILCSANPEFATDTHTLLQIKRLSVMGIIAVSQYEVLKKAYEHYHHGLHQKLLQAKTENLEDLQREVQRVCEELYRVN